MTKYYHDDSYTVMFVTYCYMEEKISDRGGRERGVSTNLHRNVAHSCDIGNSVYMSQCTVYHEGGGGCHALWILWITEWISNLTFLLAYTISSVTDPVVL